MLSHASFLTALNITPGVWTKSPVNIIVSATRLSSLFSVFSPDKNLINFSMYFSLIIMLTSLLPRITFKVSLAKLKIIHNLVNFERDTLNVILGNNEVSIIINEKYMEKLIKFLSGEKILNKEQNLVTLTIIFTSDD